MTAGRLKVTSTDPICSIIYITSSSYSHDYIVQWGTRDSILTHSLTYLVHLVSTGGQNDSWQRKGGRGFAGEPPGNRGGFVGGGPRSTYNNNNNNDNNNNDNNNKQPPPQGRVLASADVQRFWRYMMRDDNNNNNNNNKGWVVYSSCRTHNA
jgi:hypothetical protein